MYFHLKWHMNHKTHLGEGAGGGGVIVWNHLFTGLLVITAFQTLVATSSRQLDDADFNRTNTLNGFWPHFYNFSMFNAPKCRIHRQGGVGEVGSLDPSCSAAKPWFPSNHQPKGSVPAAWVPLALKVWKHASPAELLIFVFFSSTPQPSSFRSRSDDPGPDPGNNSKNKGITWTDNRDCWEAREANP